MATKRSVSQVHPSRRGNIPSEPRRKRQKPDNAGPKSFKKAYPVNELKSQIRSLKRLLEKNDDLPANVKQEKERALQTAQHELAEAEKAKQRSEMIGRYHKVRFFDRQTATKRLKRARKEWNEVLSKGGALNEPGLRFYDAEVDVAYAKYYPLDQHYVPLFPRKRMEEGGDEDEETVTTHAADREREGDPEMWQRVKQCMKDGTLNDLRDGKLERPSVDQDKVLPRTEVGEEAQKDTAEGNKPKEDEDDDSEGFFE